MEVILNKDVEGVGKTGNIIKVKDGYARNFLIPNGLALPANPVNLAKLKQEKKSKLLQQEKNKKEAEELKGKLEVLSLTIPALVHEKDKLYGNVTNLDIAAALKEEGFDIDKNTIILDKSIDALGIYEVNIKLHSEISVKIKVWIVKK